MKYPGLLLAWMGMIATTMTRLINTELAGRLMELSSEEGALVWVRLTMVIVVPITFAAEHRTELHRTMAEELQRAALPLYQQSMQAARR